MTDTEFLISLRNGSLTPEQFQHEHHFRLAHIHLSALPFSEAVVRFKKDLLLFVERVGALAKYHETVTMAYLIVIRRQMDQLPGGHTWEDFRTENGALLDRSNEELLNHYSTDRLFSDVARIVFVAPDRQPLPFPDEIRKAEAGDCPDSQS